MFNLKPIKKNKNSIFCCFSLVKRNKTPQAERNKKS